MQNAAFTAYAPKSKRKAPTEFLVNQFKSAHPAGASSDSNAVTAGKQKRGKASPAAIAALGVPRSTDTLTKNDLTD